MKNETVLGMFCIVSLHLVYLLVTYDVQLLNALGHGLTPMVAERALMLSQFIPLIVVVLFSKLRKPYLLFLSFALCISTLYTVGDFQSGIYTATLDYNSNLIPRMRTSVHLMGYRDTGRLVVYEYHAEYFQEFVIVHFLSEISGLNYILVYASLVRLLSIVSWSILFLWVGNLATGTGNSHKTWLLLSALSLLIANQGYNFEISFGPLLLLTWFLLIARGQLSQKQFMVVLLLDISIILASFRETVLAASICLFMVLSNRIAKTFNTSNPSVWRPSVIVVSLFLFVGRIFQFSSNYYFESYANQLVSVINSIFAAFNGGLAPKGALSTVRSIGNPVDQLIALASVASFVACMGMLAILSLRYLLRERFREPISLSILIVYIFALAIPVVSYSVLAIAGTGSIRDYLSSTALARSMTPLAALTIAAYFLQSGSFNRLRTSKAKVLRSILVICLSISLIFAPFLFLRGEVKSNYDRMKFAGNDNDAVAAGTSVYYFVLDRITSGEIVALNPAREPSTNWFFVIYYATPLEYRLGNERVVFREAVTSSELTEIYDNGMYIVAFGSSFGSNWLFINQSIRAG